MGGKRFGVGLAAGLLAGLALVAVSGGLGVTPLGQFSARAGPANNNPPASTSTLTVSSTTTQMATFTVSASTTYGGSSAPPLSPNETGGLYTSTSTTTVSITMTSASSTTKGSPSDQGAGQNANSGVTDGGFTPSGNRNPTYLTNLTQQPIVSNAEILVPVLVAFLLGAFLYRVTAKERERTDAEV